MERSWTLLLVTLGVLIGGVFAVDLYVPLGVSVWLPYVGVVMLSLWLPSRWQTYATATVCSVLIVLALLLSGPGIAPFWISAINRLLGIFALWIAAVVGVATRQTLQLQETNRRLQQEIEERERLQMQLLRTQRLESVGVLASGIAHDFNNLLTPILMAVKLLREERSNEEKQLLLATLQASAERGAETVRQLLTFAGGTRSQQESTVQPRHIIKEIKTILEHTFPKTIHIQVRVAEDLQLVQAEATHLSQVLMNLCINARDAMSTGGTLTIEASNVQLGEEATTLHPDAHPGHYVLLAVTDTGCGIPAEVLDRVFDPFFTTKGAGKGTGLGLSTALGIVRSHDGFILLDSEPGRGSRFAVYLPAVGDGQRRPEQPQLDQLPLGRGEMILVVDDEPFILETTSTTLQCHGYQVMKATDGKEAVELYRQHQGQIQAVLLDMMMPGMDGQATMATLEQIDPKVKILASSGLRISERVEKRIAERRGVFLSKPYTDEQLLLALARVLEPQRGK